MIENPATYEFLIANEFRPQPLPRLPGNSTLLDLFGIMPDVFHRNFFLHGPAGRLEATLWTSSDPNPARPARTEPAYTEPSKRARVAVFCHPHPLFGGTMHNKVVFQAAKALHRRGIPVLRFNFRGAGLSQGVHDNGRGETDDVRTAIDYLAREFPGRKIVLGGFSFGAWVGLHVGCENERVSELIGLGLPVNDSDLSYLLRCAKPKLFIQGGNDEFGSRQRVETLFAAMPGLKRLVVVEGADHFFTGKLDQLAAAIDSWMAEGGRR